MAKRLKFGKCRVLKKLGAGATAVVYHAWHTTLNMPVAVKVLPKSVCERKPDYAERFLREARTAARLTHPNVVRVIDCGVTDGYYYMVMDYVEGQDCLQLSRENPDGMDWRRASEIVRQAALGLQYAAGHGIVHRDVKPANIMLAPSGQVMITDLGLAKLSVRGTAEITDVGRTLGTPNYMSPEQVRNPSTADLRADIYSLGATFYRFVVGRPPFVGRSPMDVVAQHLRDPVVPPVKLRPDLPNGLSAIICKMMAKLPDDRYQTYDGLLRDMDDLIEGHEVSAVGFRDNPLIGDAEELSPNWTSSKASRSRKRMKPRPARSNESRGPPAASTAPACNCSGRRSPPWPRRERSRPPCRRPSHPLPRSPASRPPRSSHCRWRRPSAGRERGGAARAARDGEGSARQPRRIATGSPASLRRH